MFSIFRKKKYNETGSQKDANSQVSPINQDEFDPNQPIDESIIRKHIDKCDDCKLLTPQWLAMSKSLHQLLMYTNSNIREKADRKHNQLTLWEDNTNVTSIIARILIEQGKLNFLLRALHNYKIAAASDSDEGKKQWNADILAASFGSKLSNEEVADQACLFELSAASLLKFSFAYIEAIQTIDMPLLIQHITFVLTKRVTNPFDEERIRDLMPHESACIDFLHLISNRIEEYDESRWMDILEDHQTLTILIQYIQASNDQLDPITIKTALLTINNIFSTETFTADPSRFFGESEKSGLQSIKPMIQTHISSAKISRASVSSILKLLK